MLVIHRLAIAVGVALILCASPAARAQTTWVGTSGTALWSVGSNWGGVPPTAGGTSSLVFSGSTLLSSTNNIANLSVSGISFTNTTVGGGGFVLSGSTVALRGGISTTALSSGSVTDEIALGLVLTGGNITVTIANGNSHTLLISGSIGQDGTARTFSKAGNGLLTLSNTTNSFSTLSISAAQGVSVNQIGTAGLPSTTGTGGVILSQSLLTYTGPGETTNKQLQVGTIAANTNGATIANNGSGPLNLIGSGGLFTSSWASASASRTLTLDGSNTGNNVIAATMGDVNSGTTALALTKAGTGMWILSGSNTYTGATTVSAGTLQIGGGGTTGSLNTASSIAVSSGATLAFSRSNTMTQGADFNSVLSGAGNVTQLGAGTLVLNGANTYSGTTRVVTGTLQIGSGGSTGSLNTASAITGSAGGTLAFNRSDAVTQGTHFNSVIGGAIGVSQLGSGTLVLSGNNIYSGGTQIAAGTLQLGSSTALPASSALTLGTGSTAGVLAFSGNTATLGSITFNGSGSQLSGTASGGKLNLLASGTNNATITITSGSHALHPDTTLQSNTVINVAAGSLFSLHGVIDGSKSLTQIGSGTVAIYGANSYSGGTYLNGGYLSVQNTGALGSGTVTIDGNSILNLNNTILANTVVFGSGSGAIINSGSLVNVTGTYSITSGTGTSITTNYSLQPGSSISFVSNLASTVSINGSAVGTFSSDVLEAGTVLVNAGGRGTFSGGMAGNVTTSGSTLFSGDVLGNVTVSGGTATFTGATGAASAINVNSGLGVVTGTIGNTAHATAAGATLEIRGRVLSTADVNAEAGATVKLMGNQAFDGTTLDNDGSVIVNRTANLTLAAVISGTGSLTKSDATTLTLTGTSTFTGLTTVSAGTLTVNGGLASPVAVATGAVVGGSGVIGGTLSGAGLVSPGNSPGILTAGQYDATSGLDAAFEFTAFTPAYNASSASLNDVLQLTSGSPFIGTLGSGNVINVYFNVDSIASGESFEGGFFTDLSAGDLFSAVQNATFQYWIKDNAGTTPFGGVNYSTLTSVPGITGVTLSTAAVTRTFSSGSVNGSVTQFVIVPEPASLILSLSGTAAAIWAFRRRR